MNHILRTGLLLLGLVAVPALAVAGGNGGKRADDLARYDSDGDGKLDRAERQAMYTSDALDNFAAMDTDGDGLISPTEAEARSAILARRFHVIDTNDDGFLTRQELNSTRRKPVR